MFDNSWFGLLKTYLKNSKSQFIDVGYINFIVNIRFMQSKLLALLKHVGFLISLFKLFNAQICSKFLLEIFCIETTKNNKIIIL